MSQTTITVTTWTCDICGAETTSGSRPDGWADITLWNNPGPDTHMIIGAECWKSQAGRDLAAKDVRVLPA